jgi:dolichyl-phosphate-mannose--protein O-mannosyl transferase
MAEMWSQSEAKTVREMIFKEDEFISHRLSWLVTVQGLLFAALGFAWEKAHVLINPIATTGIVVSITSFVGLLLAHKAIKKLKEKWEDQKKRNGYVGPDVIGFSAPSLVNYFLPWFVLPTLFVVVWIWLLILVKHCN